MKKIISLMGVALVLVIAMLAVSLTGCGTTNTDTQKDNDQVSGTVATDGFESITDTEDACKYNQELTSTGDVVQTVSSNPNAIGYASLASVKDTVKLIYVKVYSHRRIDTRSIIDLCIQNCYIRTK